MKRIVLVLLVGLVAVSLAPAQSSSFDFATFQSDFQTFATAVAGTLASSATLAGLDWSTAYVGQFPHLGVGVSVGGGLIPYADMQPIFSLVGVQLPSQLAPLETYGIPLPAASVDARIGGFILPFDIGLKFGTLPSGVQIPGLQLTYLMAGADVRVALLKDEGFMPSLSVGAGYTYFKGGVTLPGVVPASTIDISQAMDAYYSYKQGSPDTATYSLNISPADFGFNWQSSVLEAKVQLSKKILLFTPTVGLSAAYGISSAGGSITSTVTTSSNTSMTDVAAAFAQAGYTVPSSTGISVAGTSNGWSFRAFGGLGISLLILNVDVTASYDLLTQSLGGGVNVRLQI